MYRNFTFRLLTVSAVSVAFILALAAFKYLPATLAAQATQSPGSLQVLDESGKPKAVCPLKHTDVRAELTGFLARVNVTQEFENPFKEKIEAVYTFPLPANAAVDDMTMVVGERTVRGKILRREEAQAVYEAAKTGGQVASLLNQERPNIFTQSVANILPGEKIKITISYVETLKYEAGSYEFSFPMVVGPRYMPGTATGRQGSGFSPDTTQVPDASIISPKLVPEGMRAGHDISLDIMLDAGVPLDGIEGKSHEVETERLSAHSAHIRLKNNSTIPNQDFILKYDVAGKNIQDALLTHRSGRGGYFSLILQPPERITVKDVTPKELVFVLDTSGSMEGFPIEKAKETMKLALDGLYPADTFNLITFAGDTRIMFPKPVPATPGNLKKAQAFLAAADGNGGTEMMKAIKASLDASDAQDHVRIVCFMTDGYVGNEMEIISEVQKHPNARVFAFGIGSSVNRFLLDKMAEAGRGEVEYVALNDDGSAAAKRFHERVRNPLLTDISVDWSQLPVADVYPARIPDLFGAKPVILNGRYTAAGRGVIRLKGKMAGQEVVREIPVEFPESESQHDVLASLWARLRIDDLTSQDYSGMQQGAMKPELKETITNLGLEYRLMTQFTSFVAVEEMIVTDSGQPRRIDVPVEVPEGVNRASVDGEEDVLRVAGGPVRKLMMFAPGVVNSSTSVSYSSSEMVTVTDSGGIDSSSSSVGTTIDGNLIDPAAASAARVSKSKSSRTKRGSGGGSGAASAGGVGGYTLKDGGGAAPVVSPQELKRRELVARLHPALLAIVDRLKKNEKAAAGEATFTVNGKAEIQIWLSDKSEETLATLKALGFEVVLDPKSAKLIIGRIPIEKLEALGELKVVRYAAPNALSK
ncbi:MAG TPA: VIT and VWA domain-containing protein [Pyrinomonadaceae bacterium]|jgi:Ca-activated chloride channel family protein|nr:VIT and VWA domain-containing protein [Pyrinomonadaceae bacterium]